MTEYVYHKRFRIQAAPFQLADSGEWELNIYIEFGNGSELIYKHFSDLTSYESREEAITHCFNFGRQVIDEGLSVRDMAAERDKDATKSS